MNMTQTYTLLNTACNEILGDTAVVNEDLSNVIDIGHAVFDSGALDNYVASLVNQIGKMVFVDRPYVGTAPSVLMTEWEYGSVMCKVSTGLPEATENKSWELTDGTSYDVNVFTQPSIIAKFYNTRTTFEIPMSFTEKQIKESFTSAAQLNAFFSMLYTSIDNSMNVKTEAMIERAINNMIGQTIYSEYTGGTYNASSGVRAINLLYLYNTEKGTELTASECLTDPEFIRFATVKIGITADRMKKMSQLFNVGEQPRFTPDADRKVVLLSEFVNGAKGYLQSDTFHNELVELPKADIVPYWQGSGTDYGFDSTSKIDIKVKNGDSTATVTITGVLGCMFDKWACGVSNFNRRVTSDYNARAEFYNNWYKQDAGYFNDLNENFVVFFVA